VKGGLARSIECKQSRLPPGSSKADLCCFGRAFGNPMLGVFDRSLTFGCNLCRQGSITFAAGARLYRSKMATTCFSGKLRRQFSILQFSWIFTKTCALF
jgi:hypothetical protein